MDTPNYVLDTQNKISSYLAKLSESLKKENQDLRTLSSSKRLHRHAEASGFDNWQQMLAKVQEQQFMSTLVNEYGLSDEYAYSAWHTTRNNACNPNYPTCAAQLARDYCQRFNIKKSESAVTQTTEPTSNLVNDANSHYESILTSLEEDDDSFFDNAVYGSSVTSVEVSFSLSSNTTMNLKVDVDDLSIISGHIRAGGFGTPAIINFDSDRAEKLSIAMRDEIKDAVFNAFGGEL